jgi:hypothetical protein
MKQSPVLRVVPVVHRRAPPSQEAFLETSEGRRLMAKDTNKGSAKPDLGPSSKDQKEPLLKSSKGLTTKHGYRIVGPEELKELGIDIPDTLIINFGQGKKPKNA